MFNVYLVWLSLALNEKEKNETNCAKAACDDMVTRWVLAVAELAAAPVVVPAVAPVVALALVLGPVLVLDAVLALVADGVVLGPAARQPFVLAAAVVEQPAAVAQLAVVVPAPVAVATAVAAEGHSIAGDYGREQ